MEMYIIVCLAALVASFLSLFSGFGLSTVLIPVFSIFFPIGYAIGMAAFVHMFNNLFKVGMFGKHANWKILLRFALPAVFATFIGAYMLGWFSGLDTVATYEIGMRGYGITWVNLIVGLMMVLFAFFELLPKFEKMEFDQKWLPLGGSLSGFFGGLTGQQGALRSAFLVKAGLTKEAFIGTGVMTAFMIDLIRITVYVNSFPKYSVNWELLLAATIAAFIGAFIGARIFKKVTLHKVQLIVGVLLIVRGLLLASGLA